MWPRRKPRTLGQRGEDAAARHLKRAGYKILERNRFLGRYEIDIIAQEGDTIAFVEVRTRAALDKIPPEDSIGPQKQHRIRQAARRYIDAADDESMYYRFDVVSVIMPEKGKPEIRLIRNAFEG
jgi:putative endonuclease